MSLQEDVIRTMTDPLCSVEHRADKIVSKILDAVIDVGNFLPYSAPAPGQQTFYNQAVKDYQEDINRLRDEL